MFDTIIFIVILSFMWKGYKKEFHRELPAFSSLVVALITGIIFYSVVALFLNSTPLPDLLGRLTTPEFLEKVSSQEFGDGTVNQVFGAITYAENKERVVGEFLVMFISLIIVFVGMYVASTYFLKKKKMFKNVKVARQLSPALGGVVGIFEGIVYAYIAIAILVVCEPIIPTDFVRTHVEKSEIARVMYEDNYVANIVARQDYLTSRN